MNIINFKISKYSYVRIILILSLMSTLSISKAFGESSEELNYKNTQWGNTALSADQAHKFGYTGKGVKIAVVDTGVDYRVENLKNNLLPGYSSLTNSYLEDAKNQDLVGHGTHVSGIIAGEGIGSNPIGIAPESKILPVQVLSEYGGTDVGIANGIKFAIKEGVRIINLSLGGEVNPFKEGAPITCQAIDEAYKANIIVVVASGNSKGEGNPLNQPASCQHAISVAAVDENLNATNFSSFDSTVFVAAPGENIISSTPDIELPGNKFSSRYEAWAGTSMAAPFVSGVIALYLEKYPSATVEEVKNALITNSIDLSQAGRDVYTGYGLPNLVKLLNLPGPDVTLESLKKDISKNKLISIVNAEYEKERLTVDLSSPDGVRFSKGKVILQYIDGSRVEKLVTPTTGEKKLTAVKTPENITYLYAEFTDSKGFVHYSEKYFSLVDMNIYTSKAIDDKLNLISAKYVGEKLEIKYKVNTATGAKLSLSIYNDDIDIYENIDFISDSKGSLTYTIKNKELLNHALMITLSSEFSSKNTLLSPKYYIDIKKEVSEGSTFISVNASFLSIIENKLCKNEKIKLYADRKLVKSMYLSKLGEAQFVIEKKLSNVEVVLGKYSSRLVK